MENKLTQAIILIDKSNFILHCLAIPRHTAEATRESKMATLIEQAQAARALRKEADRFSNTAFTSTRKQILAALAEAGNSMGDLDMPGLEGAENRLLAACDLTRAYQSALSGILHAAGHPDAVKGIDDCLSDMTGDHFHGLRLDLEAETADLPRRDPNAEHRLGARQLGIGRAA